MTVPAAPQQITTRRELSVESGLGAPNATPEAGVMVCVDTKLDGSTLVVRIPMRFQRRGGRKWIVAPDGHAVIATNKPQPDGTLAKALARRGAGRSWSMQRLYWSWMTKTPADVAVAPALLAKILGRI